MDRGFVIKNNDLLFEIYFSATSKHDDRYYSTQVVYSVMLPNLLQLYSRLLRLSVGNEIPWSELADAKDLYTVVEHVHSWTTKDINIQGLPPRPGN